MIPVVKSSDLSDWDIHYMCFHSDEGPSSSLPLAIRQATLDLIKTNSNTSFTVRTALSPTKHVPLSPHPQFGVHLILDGPSRNEAAFWRSVLSLNTIVLSFAVRFFHQLGVYLSSYLVEFPLKHDVVGNACRTSFWEDANKC
jgi:hypothetical protein